MINNQYSMQGELREAILPSLLRYMKQKKMSGQLQLRPDAGTLGKVYVVQGDVLDAQTEINSGIEALQQMNTWFKGEYLFAETEYTAEPSIHMKFERVLDSLNADIRQVNIGEGALKAEWIFTKLSIAPEQMKTLSIELVNTDLFIMNELDGERSLAEIATALDLPFTKVFSAIRRLLKYQLVKRIYQHFDEW